MKTTLSFLLLLSFLTALLSGCANLTGGAGSSALATKTGLGILNLEGDDLAVDEQQARSMLPLWQALLTLGADSNTTPEEINALNDQILESLSDEQRTAISGMSWDETEIAKAATGYSSSDGLSSTIESGAAASASTFPAQTGGGMPGGAPPDGGGEMMAIAGNGGGTSVTSSVNLPGQTEREEAGGTNLLVAQAVIALLQSKLALT
jgi:hypothetical protein